MHKVTPKKRLGQHFLKDLNIARKIIGSVPHYKYPVVEIGPGTGVLTRFLISQENMFYAFDVDQESIEFLKNEYPDHAEHFVLGDFLKLKMESYIDGKFIVLGNFPYNISSQLFFKILDYRQQVDEVICMIQKEVAERICSGPGSKTYGILSVLLQAFFVPKYLFTASEKVFIPPPKVKSAVMSLSRNEVSNLDCDETLFFKIVKKAFNQRRKTIRNSLKEFELLNVEKELLGMRPEQLCVQDFVNIVQKVNPYL